MNEDLHHFTDNAANAQFDATASARMRAPAAARSRTRSWLSAKPRRRRRAPWALLIVALLLVSGGVAGAIGYTVVQSRASQLQADLTTHLQKGQIELEAARASLTSANFGQITNTLNDGRTFRFLLRLGF